MKHVLRLEAVGDNIAFAQRRGVVVKSYGSLLRWQQVGRKWPTPWVARLVGHKPGRGFSREFLKCEHKDYGQATGTGSRGVYCYYVLDVGPDVYEVNELTGWKDVRRWYCRASEAGIEEVTLREAIDHACSL